MEGTHKSPKVAKEISTDVSKVLNHVNPEEYVAEPDKQKAFTLFFLRGVQFWKLGLKGGSLRWRD